MRTNLFSQVAENLGRRIVSGATQPGDVMPQEENLCETFGVSRTVVREAVKSLAAKGLVETRPKRGTTVRPLHFWNFLDAEVLQWQNAEDADGKLLAHLTELRKTVEPAAAAMTAERASDADRELIATASRDMAANTDNIEAFLNADRDFHIAILRATGNPFFCPVANVIDTTLRLSLGVTNRKPLENRKSIPVHEAVLHAILARDPELARSTMTALLEDAAARLARLKKPKRR